MYQQSAKGLHATVHDILAKSSQDSS